MTNLRVVYENAFAFAKRTLKMNDKDAEQYADEMVEDEKAEQADLEGSEDE